VVIDCANGAAYKVAPRVLRPGRRHRADRCSPNGRNINDGCGSTQPDLLRMTVSGSRPTPASRSTRRRPAGHGGHLGRIVDGDQLMFVLACARHAAGQLQGPWSAP